MNEPPQRWAALACLGFSMVLAMATWFSASAVLPQLREHWQLASDDVSLLTIAVQLGFVAGALVSATLGLADTLRSRSLVLLGATGAAIANSFLLVAPNGATVIAVRFMTGVFLAGVYPPALKSMATWFNAQRGTALGIMVGALTIGSALPYLIRGIGGFSWQTVVATTSVLTIAGGLTARFAGRDGPFPFPSSPFMPRQALHVFSSRGVRLATIGYFGHMWELYAMWTWFSVFYLDVLENRGTANAETLAAVATFAVIAIGSVGCWFGGYVGDRWGRAKSAALSLTISGLCALTIGLARGAGPVVVLLIGLVWGFWVIADSGQFSTLVTEWADQRFVGTAVTLQLAAGFTLTTLTIWLVPLLRDWFGWEWPFAILALGPVLGILAMLRLIRAPVDDEIVSDDRSRSVAPRALCRHRVEADPRTGRVHH